MANDLIHVLLIEDNPGDARLIQELLADARGLSTRLTQADRLSAGLERLSEAGADVVLLDLSLPDSKGFETFSKLRARAKDVPVILLTGLDDEELAMRALREGAQDYVVKGSITSQSLGRAVRFAVERHRKMEVDSSAQKRAAPGRVLGFQGVKGGVGTTTAVLNVAAILAKRQKSVIALELRSFGGSFSLQTQQSPNRNLKHLLDLEIGAITEAELKTCLVGLPSGVNAIFSPQKPDEFREIQPAQAEAIIRSAAQMTDYVIVDLPPHLSSISQAAVRSSDMITLVVEREAACAAAGRQVVQLIRHWGVDDSAIAALIVIKDALGAFLSAPEVSSRLGCPIAGILPPAAELCSTSARVGTPIVLLEPESIAATSLGALADKLIEPAFMPMSV